MSNVIDPAAPEAGGARRGRRALLVLGALVTALALVLVGGSFAYAQQYDGKALPGTTVLGQDVAGKSADQIRQLVADRAESVQVTVTAGDQTREASLTDLGVSIDADATAAQAASHDEDVVSVLRSTLDGERPVQPVVSVDRAATAAYAASLVPDDRTAPADAQVVYDEKDEAWSMVPGHAGQGIDSAAFADVVEKQAPALESFAIDQPIAETQPALTVEMAQSALDRITASLDQPMQVTAPDGTVFEVSKKTRSSWLQVGPNEANDGFALTADGEAVSEWVSGKAEKAGTEPQNGIEQVDATGATVKVLSEKKDGAEVSNADAVVQQLSQGLTEGTAVDARFETTPLAATVTKAKAPTAEAAPSAESTDPAATPAATPAAADPSASPSAAPAAPTGEKWIDVDLTNKTVTAYEGETPVYGPVKIVDGKDGKTTPGTYKIWHRTEKQDMTNGTRGVSEDDPDYYYTKDVPWVQYFNENIAFHGAPWRKSFGYSGSHGCVNMRVKDAKWLWDWAEMGDTVVVHY